MNAFDEKILDEAAAGVMRAVIIQVANFPEVISLNNGIRSAAGAKAILTGVLVEACRREAIRLTEGAK